jgi:V/A-type H+-transporting ATPase subunit I
VTETIEAVTNGRCYLEWKEPEKDSSIKKEQVPVQLEHSKVLSPFQWLVENYSVPQYGSIDPTVLVFATYLIMFGLMFGDAGHGAVLMLTGWLIRVILKKKHTGKSKQPRGEQNRIQNVEQQGNPRVQQKESSAAKLGELIFWCGAAAVVMGILFGSYFGRGWLPPLWFDYHSIVSGHGGGSASYVSSIYDILGITIKFGIGIIGAGIVLNCVNRARSRDWFHLVFDGGGLLAGWFYAGGVYAGFYFVNSGYLVLPAAGTLFWTIGLPLLLFIAKAPLERMRHLEAGEHIKLSQLLDFLMEWIVELLELFTSYLSNTLSFMRIAGLGIAHVSLMTAFFQIAGTTSSPVGSAAILIAGNLVVIVLEGLSAGIQALRLHYYEFFSKYFCGSGRVYKPISLRRSS